jgi:hypothetical protein
MRIRDAAGLLAPRGCLLEGRPRVCATIAGASIRE